MRRPQPSKEAGRRSTRSPPPPPPPGAIEVGCVGAVFDHFKGAAASGKPGWPRLRRTESTADAMIARARRDDTNPGTRPLGTGGAMRTDAAVNELLSTEQRYPPTA